MKDHHDNTGAPNQVSANFETLPSSEKLAPNKESIAIVDIPRSNPFTKTPLTKTPEPPYYAVIFTSQRTSGDQGYSLVAERMVELARDQPGFLGVEGTRNSDGFGITVSYWTSEDAIRQWKKQAEHLVAQENGKRLWYEDYSLRIARVERAYGSTH